MNALSTFQPLKESLDHPLCPLGFFLPPLPQPVQNAPAWRSSDGGNACPKNNDGE
jgi:hypothetical protein